MYDGHVVNMWRKSIRDGVANELKISRVWVRKDETKGDVGTHKNPMGNFKRKMKKLTKYSWLISHHYQAVAETTRHPLISQEIIAKRGFLS